MSSGPANDGPDCSTRRVEGVPTLAFVVDETGDAEATDAENIWIRLLLSIVLSPPSERRIARSVCAYKHNV